jgi:hypothetical protein
MLHSSRFATPILLMVFNRPETTALVFQRIKSMRPTYLFVAADGPRPGVAGELQRCQDARGIATAVDWPCHVQTFFRDRNLGCGLAVSSAITWFFDHVDEGIILEDDCVPSHSFFRFCRELLDFYRQDSEIMHVAGNSFQYGRSRGSASYYFSKYANVWGWASWRRAWKYYDFSLRPAWELRDTWDTQWQLSLERCKGVAVAPNANLVKNIGFGPGATHTKPFERPSLLNAEEIEFPLVHPRQRAVNRAADIFTYYSHYRNVRYLRLTWLYWIWDFIYFRLKAVKRMIIRTASRIRLGCMA